MGDYFMAKPWLSRNMGGGLAQTSPTKSTTLPYLIIEFPQETIASLAQNEAPHYKDEKYRLVNFAAFWTRISAAKLTKFLTSTS